jgi:4-amino-4-deoxy-L-arabinose transferase-like glycosyltransferase
LEGSRKPDRPAPRTVGPAASPELAPKLFAVPEGSRESRRAFSEKVIAREAADENEERLINKPVRVAGRRLSVEDDRFEKWFVVLLLVVGTLAVLVTSGSVGMSWDEAYYVDAGLRTREWIGDFLSPRETASSPAALRVAWDSFDQEPRGHASIPRVLVALGMFLTDETPPSLFVMRLPMALCYGLSLALLYLLMKNGFGRVTAWISLLSYFFMPRVFGHAHFAVTETPTIMVTLLVFYAFLKGLKSTRWAVLTGIFLGVAFATKINTLGLPLILLPWLFVFHRKESLPLLYSIIFLSPLTMVLCWPWLWSNPGLAFSKYLFWNFNHSQIGFFYLGRVYNSLENPVPWFYPFHMVTLTVPISILILAGLGVARTLRAPRKHYIGLLFLWAALFPLLLQSSSSFPKYDGVRLFLQVFPFIAALAGIGGGVVVRIAAFYDRPERAFPRGQLAALALILLIVLEGGAAFLRVQPNYLTYVNVLAGGRKRAMERLELTYWGEALNRQAIESINALVPDGSTLCPRAINIETLRHHQARGLLKKSISLVEDRGADFHLLQYRRGMFGDPDRALFEGWEERRVAVFPSDGVGLIGLYQTGPAFENYWRSRPSPAPGR